MYRLVLLLPACYAQFQSSQQPAPPVRPVLVCGEPGVCCSPAESRETFFRVHGPALRSGGRLTRGFSWQQAAAQKRYRQGNENHDEGLHLSRFAEAPHYWRRSPKASAGRPTTEEAWDLVNRDRVFAERKSGATISGSALLLIGAILSSCIHLFSAPTISARKLDPLWYRSYLPTPFYLSAVPAGLEVTIMAVSLCNCSLNAHVDPRVLSEVSSDHRSPARLAPSTKQGQKG